MSLNTFIDTSFCENTTRELLLIVWHPLADTSQLIGRQLLVQKDKKLKTKQKKTVQVSRNTEDHRRRQKSTQSGAHVVGGQESSFLFFSFIGVQILSE